MCLSGLFTLEMGATGAALYLVDAANLSSLEDTPANAAAAAGAVGGGPVTGDVLQMLALNMDAFMTYKIQVRCDW